MWNLLIVVTCLAALAGQFFRFLDEVWISDTSKRALQQRFENWWLALADADSRSVALALATKLAEAVDV